MARLVLIPGLAADATTWAAQREGLADAVVCDAHFRQGTLPAMAAALLAENQGPLVLCGASMGGMIALECLRQAPSRIAGLALLGSSARPDTPEIAALRAKAFAMIDDGRYEEMLSLNVPLSFHPDRLADRELTRAYLDMLLRAGPAQLVRQNLAVAARPDSRPLLAGIACPTLVICGDADLVTPIEHSFEIAALVPGSEMQVLERCGHMLTMERPQGVNAALRRWLARLPH